MGKVTINQITIYKPNHTVRLQDTVVITLAAKQSNFTPADVPFDVIDEQQDFLIINKPAGLLVHHADTKPDELSLVNGLLHRYPDMQALESLQRPGIVHRIDKNTSGLLLIARKQQAQAALAALFKERKIHKVYRAVVQGHPAPAGKIDLPIGRHPIDRHKMATFGIETRSALSYYKVIESFGDASLLEINIIPGRTHQVRVHCASMGHGLLGDSTYGVSSPLIARQALHAWHMSFSYAGKDFSYTAPLPDDLEELLAKLRSTPIEK